MQFSVEPTTVRVLSAQSFYLRAQGSGFGFIRCGRMRRWVWGAFEQTFLVHVQEHGRSTEVVVEGIGIGRSHIERIKLDLRARVLNPPIAPRVMRPHIVGLPKLRGPSVRLVATTVTARFKAFRGGN